MKKEGLGLQKREKSFMGHSEHSREAWGQPGPHFSLYSIFWKGRKSEVVEMNDDKDNGIVMFLNSLCPL